MNNSSNEKIRTHFGVGLQLGLAAVVAQVFAIESVWYLPELLTLAFGGFALQSFLNPNHRILLFALLSQAMLLVVIGLKAAILVSLVGGSLVLILWWVHSAGLRLALSLLWWAGLLGIMLYPPAFLEPHRVVIFSLSSLFALRWFWYINEREIGGRGTLALDASYFFNFPAIALWFFPLVSYRRWKESLGKELQAKNLNRGIYWIVLGILQLILYRLLEYYLYISSLHVVDADTFWQHIFTNFFLLVRVSGFFHVAVGVLALFGFSLPKPVDSYFLARGFADFWRRVNVYFREFLLEVVHPKITKWLGVKRVFPSIFLLFLVSGLLYNWQYFSFHVSFPIKGGEILFWILFGSLVSWELAFVREKDLQTQESEGWKSSLNKGFGVGFTFLAMSGLWSLWAAPSLIEWRRMLGQSMVSGTLDWWMYPVLLLILGLLLGVGHRLGLGKLWYQLVDGDQNPKKREWRSLTLLGLFLAVYGFSVGAIVEDRTGLSNKFIFPENYFERLLMPRNLDNFQWKKVPRKFVQFKDTEAAELVQDIRNQIKKPNARIYFKEKLYTTNRWGMRDRDYEYFPADSVVRVGFAGGSFVVGSGISDEEVFDQILEDNYKAMGLKPEAEFLNYSNSGYDLIQCLYHFEQQKHYNMGLDYFVYVSQGVDLHKNIKSILIPFNKGWPQPYDYVEDIVVRSGIQRNMEERQQIRLLEPFAKELIEKTYQRLWEVCKEHEIVPIWLYWPTISSFIDQSAYLEALAQSYGMMTINLEKVFDDVPPDSLIIDTRDRHPNGKAHRMVADALLEIFQKEFPLEKKPFLTGKQRSNGNIQQ